MFQALQTEVPFVSANPTMGSPKGLSALCIEPHSKSHPPYMDAAISHNTVMPGSYNCPLGSQTTLSYRAAVSDETALNRLIQAKYYLTFALY